MRVAHPKPIKTTDNCSRSSRFAAARGAVRDPARDRCCPRVHDDRNAHRSVRAHGLSRGSGADNPSVDPVWNNTQACLPYALGSQSPLHRLPDRHDEFRPGRATGSACPTFGRGADFAIASAQRRSPERRPGSRPRAGRGRAGQRREDVADHRGSVMQSTRSGRSALSPWRSARAR